MRSIIITLTSNLSVEVSSCLNNLSLNPVKTKILKFSETLIMSSWKKLPCYGVVNLTYPFSFCLLQAISEFNAQFRNEAKSAAPGSMQNFSCENEFYLHEDKNAFITSMALHFGLPWNRGLVQLGNGLLRSITLSCLTLRIVDKMKSRKINRRRIFVFLLLFLIKKINS